MDWNVLCAVHVFFKWPEFETIQNVMMLCIWKAWADRFHTTCRLNMSMTIKQCDPLSTHALPEQMNVMYKTLYWSSGITYLLPLSILQRNRLWWYGHVLQKEDNDWVKKCMEYEVEGTRPRGRPKKTWREIVEKDCRVRGLNTEDAMDHSTPCPEKKWDQ